MLGSAVVSLPWAYQQAGLLLGTFISFTSFIISYYTCYLIIYTARKDTDFFDTVKRYYGKYDISLVRNDCVTYSFRYMGLLYWHDNVDHIIIRVPLSILCNIGLAPLPGYSCDLFVGLTLQSGVPFGIHAESILAKLLWLNDFRRACFHLYQERPRYFHESGLYWRHFRLHADNLHHSDGNRGLQKYRVCDRHS